MAHCEDKQLVRGGVMNAGKRAEELGLKGITNSVEDVITARDIFWQMKQEHSYIYAIVQQRIAFL